MFKLRRLIFILAAMVLSAGAALALMRRIGIFEVKEIPIEFVSASGEASSSKGAVISESRLKERLESLTQAIRGKRIWEVDLTELRASLGRDEWVQDVLISRSFPNEVRVRVRPKKTVLVLFQKPDRFFPVTSDGQLLSAIAANALPDVPVLRGEVFSGASESDEALKRRDQVIKFVSLLNDRGLLTSHNISEINWSANEGYVLTLIQPKLEVKLGDDHVDLRAMRVAQVLNYLAVNNLKGRVIDASFSKKVLVRLRKGP